VSSADPAILSFPETESVLTSAETLLNNFDFSCGDAKDTRRRRDGVRALSGGRRRGGGFEEGATAPSHEMVPSA